MCFKELRKFEIDNGVTKWSNERAKRSEEETAKRLKQAWECQRCRHHELGLQDKQKGIGYWKVTGKT